MGNRGILVGGETEAHWWGGEIEAHWRDGKIEAHIGGAKYGRSGEI